MIACIRYFTVIYMMLLLGSSLHAVEQDEPAAAIVNGKHILTSDLDREIQAAMRSNPELRSKENTDTLRKMRWDVLDYLINRELISQEGEKAGLGPQDVEIDAELTNAKQRFPSQIMFEQVLEQQGLTEKKLREFIRQGLIVKKVLELKIRPTAKPVTDEDVENFYEENKEGFVESEKVSARHILIKVSPEAIDQEKADAKNRMQNILKEAKGGADFAELAKKHSQCPSAPKGGELGYFARGQMVKPFEDTAFALQPGQISNIVETRFGYHIILVQGRKPDRQMKLEEVSEEIKDALYSEELDIALERWLKPIREEATVSILLKD